MRGVFVASIVLLGFQNSALAKWRKLSLEDAVVRSDLIVVGTLRNVSTFAEGEIDYACGILHVDELLWGRIAPGENLVLAWGNRRFQACPRVEHGGGTCIYLLTSDESGYVRADHPQRTVDLSEKQQITELIAKLKGHPSKLLSTQVSIELLLSKDYLIRQLGPDPLELSPISRPSLSITDVALLSLAGFLTVALVIRRLRSVRRNNRG